MADVDPARARVFGQMATSYDRWRPAYPDQAVDWLIPPEARRVADVGAGTGKLTGLLLARGLQVAAVEPDPAMLQVLGTNHPAALCLLAGAEALPLRDASVDAVLVGQAWHWFDQEGALAEARRVIRPGGWLGMIWNGDRPRAAWQVELAGLDPDHAGRSRHDESDRWEPPDLGDLAVDTLKVAWQEQLSATALRARLATHSGFAVMPDLERNGQLDRAAALLDQEARRIGVDSVPFEHTAYCVRVLL